MKVLVTGFGPFGEVVDNPTARLVARLHGARLGGLAIEGLALPTSFSRAKSLVAARLPEVDAVLMTGVAEGSAYFRVETLGRNHDDARLSDVDGARPRGAIEAGAPATLPVTIDAVRVRDAIVAAGLAAELSESAGAYVCNHLLFSTLRIARIPAGFLHVPEDRATHAPPRTARTLDDHLRALEAALGTLAQAGPVKAANASTT